MNDEQTYRKFVEVSLSRLEKNQEEGFKGVHARQDISNGRLGKLEKFKLIFVTTATVLALMSAPNLLAIVKLFQ